MLNNFADFEMAYLAPAINRGVGIEASMTSYIAKIASSDGEMIQSIGGMKVIPDYSLARVPNNYPALVLIGSFDWL